MREVVITGVGVVSPIGIGRDAFWSSLAAGRSGVRVVSRLGAGCWPVSIGGEVADFDAKQFVRPRKSLKVMSPDIQFAYAAAELACADGHLEVGAIDPQRLGVVFGADMIYCDPQELIPAYRNCMVDDKFDFSRWGNHALTELYPLWMLKYLPNMPTCHVGIAQDARGPTNTVVMGEASSLLAVAEGVRVIERGQADAMLVGGAGARLHPSSLAFRGEVLVSRRDGDPRSVCRPFDAHRDGIVNGEGSAAFLIEDSEHARRRGARILARVLGYGSTFEAVNGSGATTGRAIRASIDGVLRRSDLAPGDVGHVNANGLSTTVHDAVEAQAIRDSLGEVPVTALKSYFGNLGGGTGAVEMAGSVLAMQHGLLPATLNYEQPDPACPINVVAGKPQSVKKRTALLLNQSTTGQAVAVVLEGADGQDVAVDRSV